MVRILFVCHGNICRSPMAEFVMKELVRQKGPADAYEIASAATSWEELGNPVYPPAGHAARQMTRRDYAHFDRILGMDHANVRNIRRIAGGDPDGKITLLLDHAGRPGQEVADPWYTGDFDAAWDDILAGCEGLLAELAAADSE